jgi:hypothetical protein
LLQQRGSGKVGREVDLKEKKGNKRLGEEGDGLGEGGEERS